MSSRLWISGESPPCTQRNCWFMRAASGRQSNASMQASYTLSEYFILPGSRETTRQQRTLHVSRVLETTNSIRARLSQRAFFPPPFSFFLSFFFTRSPRFVRWTLFVLGEQQWIEEGKEKGRGGWVGEVCLLKLTGCRLKYYYEWNLWENACAMCSTCQLVFFLLFL